MGHDGGDHADDTGENQRGAGAEDKLALEQEEVAHESASLHFIAECLGELQGGFKFENHHVDCSAMRMNRHRGDGLSGVNRLAIVASIHDECRDSADG